MRCGVRAKGVHEASGTHIVLNRTNPPVPGIVRAAVDLPATGMLAPKAEGLGQADFMQFHRTLQSCFHRTISDHNRKEIAQVIVSQEVWGYRAKVFKGFVCVQAYNGTYIGTEQAYEFATSVVPRLSLGFIGREPVIREIWWMAGDDGVLERDGGDAAAIPVTDVRVMR